MKKFPTRQRPRHELFYFKGEMTCAVDWWLIGQSKNVLRVKITTIRNFEDQEVLFLATIKWDGSADLKVNKVHLCGLDDLDFLPELMARINEIRKKAIRSAA